eukprot:2244303-Rhodomonas_salina.3
MVPSKAENLRSSNQCFPFRPPVPRPSPTVPGPFPISLSHPTPVCSCLSLVKSDGQSYPTLRNSISPLVKRMSETQLRPQAFKFETLMLESRCRDSSWDET